MKILLICTALCLSACSYQYTAQQTQRFAEMVGASPQVEFTRLRQITLSPLNSICVSAGQYDNKSIEQEHFYHALSENLLISLQRRFVTATPVNTIESQRSALRSARQQDCSLLVYPLVLMREDKVWSLMELDTEIESWTDVGMDRLQLRLTVWDVNNDQVLDMAMLDSQSAWLQIGKKSTEDLLAVSINKYVEQLVAIQ